MRKVIAALTLAGMVFAVPGLGKPKQSKPDLPKFFDTSRYVFVEAAEEDSDRLTPLGEEQRAIIDVESALRGWGRYTLTINRDEAELVFVVHRAAQTNSNIPVVVGGGPPISGRNPRPSDPTNDPSQGGPVGGAGLGREIGSPDDQLSVYLVNTSGRLGARLWQQEQKNGLKGPQIVLFERLKKAVDEAYPH